MTKETGGSAFPCRYEELYANKYGEIQNSGMTLRDWFAGMALQGLIANQWSSTLKSYPNFDNHTKDLSECCFKIADAMLRERSA